MKYKNLIICLMLTLGMSVNIFSASKLDDKSDKSNAVDANVIKYDLKSVYIKAQLESYIESDDYQKICAILDKCDIYERMFWLEKKLNLFNPMLVLTLADDYATCANKFLNAKSKDRSKFNEHSCKYFFNACKFFFLSQRILEQNSECLITDAVRKEVNAILKQYEKSIFSVNIAPKDLCKKLIFDAKKSALEYYLKLNLDIDLNWYKKISRDSDINFEVKTSNECQKIKQMFIEKTQKELKNLESQNPDFINEVSIEQSKDFKVKKDTDNDIVDWREKINLALLNLNFKEAKEILNKVTNVHDKISYLKKALRINKHPFFMYELAENYAICVKSFYDKIQIDSKLSKDVTFLNKCYLDYFEKVIIWQFVAYLSTLYASLHYTNFQILKLKTDDIFKQNTCKFFLINPDCIEKAKLIHKYRSIAKKKFDQIKVFLKFESILIFLFGKKPLNCQLIPAINYFMNPKYFDENFNKLFDEYINKVKVSENNEQYNKLIKDRKSQEKNGDISIIKRTCKNCNKISEKKLVKCGICENVRYCNEECQKQHWPIHKLSCNKIMEVD